MLNQSRGFSLVELLIAMGAGLLLVAAVISLFVTVLKAESTAMKVSRLNQELQSVTDMIARDIQRAGYDAGAATLLGAASGPSSFKFDSTADLASDCIRVKYDDDGDGVLGTAETRRYSYDSAEKVVRLDTGSCTASKNTGNKISTEDTIEITALSFNLLSGSVSSGSRTVQLSITGQDKSTPALRLTLQRDIKLRNDGY